MNALKNTRKLWMMNLQKVKQTCDIFENKTAKNKLTFISGYVNLSWCAHCTWIRACKLQHWLDELDKIIHWKKKLSSIALFLTHQSPNKKILTQKEFIERDEYIRVAYDQL